MTQRLMHEAFLFLPSHSHFLCRNCDEWRWFRLLSHHTNLLCATRAAILGFRREYAYESLLCGPHYLVVIGRCGTDKAIPQAFL